MNSFKRNSQLGFTLIELLVAAALGLIVILAMTSLFQVGMNTTFTIAQRAEMQQNMRAAIELMAHDISQAGAGLPTGGLQLVYGAGSPASKYGCSQSTCYLTADTYPNSSSGTQNYMYGILPGNSNGVQGAATIAATAGQRNDSITAIYCDYTFPLTNFNFQINNPPTTVTATVVNAAVTPNSILAAGGLNVGDILLFQVATTGNGTTGSGTSNTTTASVAAEITGLPSTGSASPWTLDFNNGDALDFNQTTAGYNDNLAAVASNMTAGVAAGLTTTMTVCRLNVVSYFIQVPPAGGTVQTPRLMRQVNGLNAVPVADNIINLQFSYDVIDAVSGTLDANLPNPIASGQSPNLIQKVNIWIMGQSLTADGKKNQSMYLITSVSANDMSFCNSYSASGTACAND
jgi:prepilin-type N-terminal cleavage/methylation domain-containing protein